MIEQRVRCGVCDGRERCCLVKEHPGPHMGRYYTMTDEDILNFSEHVKLLSEDQRKALGL